MTKTTMSKNEMEKELNDMKVQMEEYAKMKAEMDEVKAQKAEMELEKLKMKEEMEEMEKKLDAGKEYYEYTELEDGMLRTEDKEYIKKVFSTWTKEKLLERCVSRTSSVDVKTKEELEKKKGGCSGGKRGTGYYTKTEEGQLLVSSGNVRKQIPEADRCFAKTYCGLRCNTRKRGTTRYCGQHEKVKSKYGDIDDTNALLLK